MNKIDTVIFDLGGVLIDWHPKYLFKKIYDDPQEMNWFLENVCNMEWNEEQDAGRPLLAGTLAKINEYPEYAEQIKAYYDRWAEMLNGPFQENVRLLEQLKRNDDIILYALTNWSSETFPIAERQYKFLEWFKGIVVSGKEKLRKPQKEIFQLILDRYNIDSAHALFIDDNLRNVEASRSMGIKSIQYIDPQQLRKNLSNLALI